MGSLRRSIWSADRAAPDEGLNMTDMPHDEQFDPTQAGAGEAASWIDRWSSDRFDLTVHAALQVAAEHLFQTAREAALTEQAAGVLAWRHRLDPSHAKALLEALAAAQGTTAAGTAAHILDAATDQHPGSST